VDHRNCGLAQRLSIQRPNQVATKVEGSDRGWKPTRLQLGPHHAAAHTAIKHLLVLCLRCLYLLHIVWCMHDWYALAAPTCNVSWVQQYACMVSL
jgi:hypothetical protein